MTETSPDFQAYEAKVAAGCALADELAPANRAALFDALAAGGIHTVVVAFDGAGDSGQIESVALYDAANASTALPAGDIAFSTAAFDGSRVEHATLAVREVIERMAYGFLEETHDGWEDGSGAYGEFTFSAAKRSIELGYNERYEASDYTHHTF